jgi:DNA-binding NarL/FixJ family response regulator
MKTPGRSEQGTGANELASAFPAEPAGAAPVRVWLVDDNHRFRQVLAGLLGPHDGVWCERDFDSGKAALAALDFARAPDVILLDVNLGRERGVDVIQPLHARAPGTRVVMLTTFFDATAQTQALQAGAHSFLLKSYSLAEITASVRQAHLSPATREVAVRPAYAAIASPAVACNLAATRGSQPSLPPFTQDRPRTAAHTGSDRSATQLGGASPLERGLRKFRALIESTGPWSRTAVE